MRSCASKFILKLRAWYSQWIGFQDWQGNTQRKLKRGFDTKRAALEWEREYLNKQTGSLNMTFGQFVEVYLNSMQPRLKPDTYAMKESVITHMITPFFKAAKVGEITPRDIAEWQNALLTIINPRTREKYRKSYLKTVHNQISAIFNFAVRYYGLKENPARIVGNMGHEKEISINFWTRSEFERFAEAIMDKPISYYAFEVLYWGGLRLGEMLALTPNDVDLKTHTISITKTYYRLNGEDYITSPKTPKSVRTVNIPKFLVEELADYIRSLGDINSDDRLFPVGKSYIEAEMKRGCKLAGLKKIRVHDLRHSHVSLLINMGFDAVSIAERTGHESIDITFRYAHMFPSVQKDMAKKLNDLRLER